MAVGGVLVPEDTQGDITMFVACLISIPSLKMWLGKLLGGSTWSLSAGNYKVSKVIYYIINLGYITICRVTIAHSQQSTSTGNPQTTCKLCLSIAYRKKFLIWQG